MFRRLNCWKMIKSPSVEWQRGFSLSKKQILGSAKNLPCVKGAALGAPKRESQGCLRPDVRIYETERINTDTLRLLFYEHPSNGREVLISLKSKFKAPFNKGGFFANIQALLHRI